MLVRTSFCDFCDMWDLWGLWCLWHCVSDSSETVIYLTVLWDVEAVINVSELFSAGFPSVSELKCALCEPCADPARGRVKRCHRRFHKERDTEGATKDRILTSSKEKSPGPCFMCRSQWPPMCPTLTRKGQLGGGYYEWGPWWFLGDLEICRFWIYSLARLWKWNRSQITQMCLNSSNVRPVGGGGHERRPLSCMLILAPFIVIQQIRDNPDV